MPAAGRVTPLLAGFACASSSQPGTRTQEVRPHVLGRQVVADRQRRLKQRHQDDVDAATGEVFNRTFAFSVVQYADGTATGTAQIESRKFQLDNFDLVIHMRIDCLHVLPDGKTAQLSGIVTRTSYLFPEAPVGEVHRFTVQDNGEPGAGVDKFSGVPPNPLARDCDDADFGEPAPARVAPTRTVNRGNIQVRA